MATKLWGGRFKKDTDPLVEEFTGSIHYDNKLAKYDVFGSMAHVRILKKAGYISAAEAAKLTRGLGRIYSDITKRKFRYDPAAEDIHTDIQNALQRIAGDAALKLHTARSRNDQVVFATKAYCRTELAKLRADMTALVSELGKLSHANRDLVIPGFTHMQHAQPVYVKDYLGAYIMMLKRDLARLAFVADNIKLTMGAGALAGTPIDSGKYRVGMPGMTIEATANALDSVSDRDFVIEILGALAIVGMHISRLSEDLIIWSTREFGFIELDDAFCTGSSLMPNKKNADVLELARGCSGRLYGNLLSVLVMMKGLPLAYNRDMQLDKEPLFNSVETVSLALRVIKSLVGTLKFNRTRIEAHLEDEALYATDLVYYLVGKGVPFRAAHTIVGRLIRYSSDNRIEIKSMTDAELKKFSDKFRSREVLKIFNPRTSVESKRSVRRA
jgi:argininosuccinate lyase